jgi:hypothetical protein
MEDNKKLIVDIVKDCLKDTAAEKKGTYWYFNLPESVAALMLVKSRWGDEKYYIVVGINIKELNPKPFPTSGEFACRQTLKCMTVNGLRQERWLDFENIRIPTLERTRRIKFIVDKIVLPFILQSGSLEGIKQLLKSGKLKGAALYKNFAEKIGAKY